MLYASNMTRPLVPFVRTITIMASLVVWQPHVDTIQPLENSGILTGRVTSTTNPVQALRVKARNTKKRIITKFISQFPLKFFLLFILIIYFSRVFFSKYSLLRSCFFTLTVKNLINI